MINLLLAAALAVICAKDCPLAGRTKLEEPRVDYRINQASATTSPWIISNGAKILHAPAGKYFYNVSGRSVPVAVAESYVFRADAIVETKPEDLAEAEKMKAFLAALPTSNLPPVSDFAVVDDGSAQMAEIMNLLVRRNLLFRPSKQADPSRLTVQIGAKDFPKAAAANPSDFAVLVRHKLTDEKRSLRVFGSENVIARFESDGKKGRLHVLSYGQRPVEGVRIRVRGKFQNADISAFGITSAKVAELSQDGDFTEFSIMEIRPYVAVDLH